MPSTDQTLLATAISEIARNITTYAGRRGEVLIDARARRARAPRRARGRARRGSGDRRPRARADRRLHDRRRARARAARARAGSSTSSTSRPARARARRSRSSSGPQRGRRGLARVARPRRRRARRTRARTRSGDVAVFVPTAAGALACVIDGLGHGPEAADAAELCADVVRANAEASAQELLQACHEALLETRGVVMTAAWFDLERSQLSWAGVGQRRRAAGALGAGAARGRRARLRRRARLPDAAACARRRCRWRAATCW